MRDGIKPAATELVAGRGTRLPPAEKCLRARHEFAHAERLGDVIVRAEFEAAHDVFLLPLRRQHEDRHFEFLRADGAADFKAVDLRQHDVEDDEVGPAIQRGVQPFFTVTRGLHAIAARDKVVLHHAQDGRVVFDDEDIGRSHDAGISMVKVLPRPGFALDAHRAVVRFDDRLHDAQAQPAAARAAREPLVGLIETAKHALRFARRKADAVVLDGEAHMAVARLGAEDDVFLVAGIFPRVVEQVEQRGDQRVGIAANRRADPARRTIPACSRARDRAPPEPRPRLPRSVAVGRA